MTKAAITIRSMGKTIQPSTEATARNASGSLLLERRNGITHLCVPAVTVL